MNAKVHLDHAHMLHLLEEMIRIRRFEAKCVELYQAQKILGFLHLYDGEEAVSVGAMQALGPDDAIVATYREHGQALARGVPAKAIMAEMFGKLEGCCRGRGGSMHIFDRRLKFYGGNAIVGGGLPLAVGIALADQMLARKAVIGRKAVTACFFGDGAVDEGEFHESLNLAVVWKLPVLFICENNLYSMGMAIARAEAETNIARKAAAYRLRSERVDGMDVIAVESAARRAADSIRETGEPFFLECMTYRLRAHSMFDVQAYRSRQEIESWRDREPIARFRKWLESNHFIQADDVASIERDIDKEISEAVAFAESAALEPVAEIERFVVMEEVPQ